MKIDKGHTFHIPVLGIGYSADTPEIWNILGNIFGR